MKQILSLLIFLQILQYAAPTYLSGQPRNPFLVTESSDSTVTILGETESQWEEGALYKIFYTIPQPDNKVIVRVDSALVISVSGNIAKLKLLQKNPEIDSISTLDSMIFIRRTSVATQPEAIPAVPATAEAPDTVETQLEPSETVEPAVTAEDKEVVELKEEQAEKAVIELGEEKTKEGVRELGEEQTGKDVRELGENQTGNSVGELEEELNKKSKVQPPEKESIFKKRLFWAFVAAGVAVVVTTAIILACNDEPDKPSGIIISLPAN